MSPLPSLAAWLIANGAVSPAQVEAALARRAVYGGGLDTALLELEAIAEPALWAALGEVTGLPIPAASLYESPPAVGAFGGAAPALRPEWWKRHRAVPIASVDGAMAVLCAWAEPGGPTEATRSDAEGAAEREAIRSAREALENLWPAHGTPVALYVAPEVRVAAARQAVFGEPMSQRLLRVLARVAGAQPTRRRWQATARAQVSTKVSTTAGASAIAGRPPDAPRVAPLMPQSRPESGERPAELLGTSSAGMLSPGNPGKSEVGPGALRHSDRPEPASWVPPPRPEPAGERAPKPEAIDDLIEQLKLGGEESARARAALVSFAKQDFGTSRRRWRSWWEKHEGEDRVEWLFEALSHKEAELRASAQAELRELTGEYFGYHYDLPRREREAARARWQSWWRRQQAR